MPRPRTPLVRRNATSTGLRRHPRGFGIVKITLASVLVVGAAVGVMAVVGGRGEPTNADTQGTADLARAEIASFEITTTASGELQARDQIELRSGVERRATIIEVIPEGTRVQKGEVLLRLNPDELQTELDEELSELETNLAELTAAENEVKIQLSNNASNLEKAQLTLRLAELALEQWLNGDRVKKRQDLNLAIDRAERELERLSEQFDRAEELYSQGFMSKNQRDIDELAYIEAQASLKTARLNLEIYESYEHDRDEETKRSDVEQARAEVDRVEARNTINLANAEARLESRRRHVQRNRTEIAEVEAQIEACTVIAPANGLVVYGTTVENSRNSWSNEGPLQIGREVRPNELLIALPDTSEMVAEVRVHESLAGRIRPGQRAQIRVEAAGEDPFGGEVESIGVLAETGGWRDPNLREYTVRLAVNGDPEVLKPSMRADATLTLGSVEETLAVPVQALFREGPVQFVYTPRGAKFVRTPVQAGRFSDLYAEITAGLEEGSVVLVREPEPGEILDRPWDEGQLQLVGLSISADGKPVAPPRRGRPGVRATAGG